MTKSHVSELVKWKSNAGVSDADMVAAIDGILPDLETLPGFGSQTLYKDKDGAWVALYVWDTQAQGVASNDLMAGKASFGVMMALVDVSSLSIEFFNQP